ncbi:MAG TPA: carboxypeptidase-like regulatory domain-containing protein, partial [Segetibacter sp.]
MLKRILVAVFTALLLPLMPFAQVTTSSMSGAVLTNSGEPLVGATVTATHQPSGTVYTTTSKNSGQYTIPNMRPGGPYRIVVTYVGYPTQTIEDISLRLSENSVVNASLTGAGTTLSGVTVTTVNRNAILSANRTGTTTNISTTQINRLPTVQ